MNTAIASKEQQFSDFVTKHHVKAQRYVAAQVGPHAAPDIVQEALLSTWRKWDDLQDRDRVGYLYGACRNGVFKEYEARKRTVLLAEIPEEAFGNHDPGFAEYDPNADALVMGLYNRKAISESTVVVAKEIAAGYTKQQIAEHLNTSISEVNRSVRELRRGFSAAALQHKIQARVPVYNLQHSSVLTSLTTVLTRREQQVIALSALGLKPIAIPALLGITHGSTRTTLSHARAKLAKEFAAPGVVVADVDASVRKAMSDVELLGLLPESPWRTDALALAGKHHATAQKAGTFNGYRGWLEVFSTVTPYLNRMAIVLAEVRNALENGLAIASQAGSFQPPTPTPTHFLTGKRRNSDRSFNSYGLWLTSSASELQQHSGDFRKTSPYRCLPPSWSPMYAAHSIAVSPLRKAPKPDRLLEQHPKLRFHFLLKTLADASTPSLTWDISRLAWHGQAGLNAWYIGKNASQGVYLFVDEHQDDAGSRSRGGPGASC